MFQLVFGFETILKFELFVLILLRFLFNLQVYFTKIALYTFRMLFQIMF